MSTIFNAKNDNNSIDTSVSIAKLISMDLTLHSKTQTSELTSDQPSALNVKALSAISNFFKAILSNQLSGIGTNYVTGLPIKVIFSGQLKS